MSPLSFLRGLPAQERTHLSLFFVIGGWGLLIIALATGIIAPWRFDWHNPVSVFAALLAMLFAALAYLIRFVIPPERREPPGGPPDTPPEEPPIPPSPSSSGGEVEGVETLAKDEEKADEQATKPVPAVTPPPNESGAEEEPLRCAHRDAFGRFTVEVNLLPFAHGPKLTLAVFTGCAFCCALWTERQKKKLRNETGAPAGTILFEAVDPLSHIPPEHSGTVPLPALTRQRPTKQRVPTHASPPA